ncbi:tyrosine-type recombinase/integrase [Pseudonocardia bannensis]|uniref:Tyrosine-type recombinase/integrase n=1 Tax=Pseudonocardia bannensis TaxID=630973 RepID=A0A848DSC6_9PSEU|nr:tyrosine-type recombinase/integrase [Pseudonocardia bannensis]NMH95425.1 tyrosine-type recombinase/integrase [Pseudonocardia bannensis]
MAGRPSVRNARSRGSIDELPSGALRVRVYAGVDPVTKKRHDLVEVIPSGPRAWAEAEAVRGRLLQQVADRRSPRTSATVDELLTRYLDQFPGSPNTLDLYRTHVRNHISPCLGHVRVGKLDAETLDSFYAELRRCRARCTGRASVEHRVSGPHECTEKCRRHVCRPLAATTIRHIHFILSGAYKRAVRWGWVSESPTVKAEPPPAPKPNPQPPTAAEAARIVTESWRDPDWGALVWTAMTTGMRRGELCAIRRSLVDLTAGRETVWLRKAIRRDPDAGWVEGDLKTHQQRRIALDAETVVVLREHIDRCDERAAALGIELPADAFLFSGSLDGSTFPTPDSVTQRYDRMATRLRIETTLHKLRHYSATELITAGVDPRTVAGRLGHGGGGTTTLKTYTAWVSEADQRAARGLGAGMPQRPAELDPVRRVRQEPRHPYERVAAAVAQRVDDGELALGELAPATADLATDHGVSLATAGRAVALLKEWGVLTAVGRGRARIAGRAVPVAVETAEPVGATALVEPSVPAELPDVASPAGEAGRSVSFCSITLRGPDGQRYPARMVPGSLADPGAFRAHLLGVARIEVPERTDEGEAWIGDFELEVAEIGTDRPPVTLRW